MLREPAERRYVVMELVVVTGVDLPPNEADAATAVFFVDFGMATFAAFSSFPWRVWSTPSLLVTMAAG